MAGVIAVQGCRVLSHSCRAFLLDGLFHTPGVAVSRAGSAEWQGCSCVDSSTVQLLTRSPLRCLLILRALRSHLPFLQSHSWGLAKLTAS